MEFRQARPAELPQIWHILQQAIQSRKEEGSQQWQNGYPNQQTIREDMENQNAYVLSQGDQILAYAAFIFGKDPTYAVIQGQWLTQDKNYAVLHRIAAAPEHKGKGVASRLFKEAEALAAKKNTFSIRVDTNYDNAAMLRVLEKLGYRYCGIILTYGQERLAFEKILQKEI